MWSSEDFIRLKDWSQATEGYHSRAGIERPDAEEFILKSSPKKNTKQSRFRMRRVRGNASVWLYNMGKVLELKMELNANTWLVGWIWLVYICGRLIYFLNTLSGRYVKQRQVHLSREEINEHGMQERGNVTLSLHMVGRLRTKRQITQVHNLFGSCHIYPLPFCFTKW